MATAIQRSLGAGLCLLLLSSALAGAAEPGWYNTHQEITKIFDAKTITAGMRPQLDTFELVFTLCGFGAVMIGSVRRVARARSGEESMGWVAGMVITVALMAVAPALGAGLFTASENLAKDTGWDHVKSLPLTWDALKVILPQQSPAKEVLNTQNEQVDTGDAAQKQDAAWTKRAWDWMQKAWGAMKTATGGFVAAIRAAANSIIIFFILLIPAIGLIVGMLLMSFGAFLREMMHQVMDVFLPMMLGMLMFAPMRQVATQFLLKYVSLALWPIAWALGNAVSLSLLQSTMSWVVDSSQAVLAAAQVAPTADPVGTSGLFVSAAPLMAWGLQVVLSVAILFSALLLIISAVAAPIALSRTLTKGACFVEDQVREAVGKGVGLASAVTGGPAAGSSLGMASPAAGGSHGLSQVAARASTSMSTAAARLRTAVTAAGGAAPMMSIAATVLSRTAGALDNLAGNEGMGGAGMGTNLAPMGAPRPGSLLNAVGRGAQPVGAAPTASPRPVGSRVGVADLRGPRSSLRR